MSAQAARKLGITELEYAQRRASGLRWCWRGQHWVILALMHKKKQSVCHECQRLMRNERLKRKKERIAKEDEIHARLLEAGGDDGIW